MITITHRPVERVILRSGAVPSITFRPTASRLVVVQAPSLLPLDLGRVVSLVFILDGGDAPVVAGSECDVEVPFDAVITGWTIVADAVGSTVVDIRKADYASYPTASSIAGTEKPTLSSAQKNQDLGLGTWTTAVAAGDILKARVETVTGLKRISINVRAERI